MLDNARGSGPEFREVQRALMLADRAAREWGGGAIGAQRPTGRNHLEALNIVGRPEDHDYVTGPAADAEARAAQSPEQSAIARAVRAVAEAAQEIDTEASVAGNAPALRATAEAAADALVAAGAVLGETFIIEQANETLRDLVALPAWKNQLGPSFE